MKQSERFLNAFINIEMQLKELLQINHLPFTQLVSKAAKINDVVAYYEFDLIEYSQLRNAITHNRVGTYDEVIAEPHEKVVLEIEHIAQSLSQPKRVVDCFSKKIYICDVNDDIKKVMRIKRDNSYSMIPVYDGKRYIGVIHDPMIARWLEVHFEAPDTSKLTIKELLQHKNKKERVVFVNEDCTVFQALQIFTRRYQDGHRITAIIISEEGKLNKKPLQILTSADVPTLLHER